MHRRLLTLALFTSCATAAVGAPFAYGTLLTECALLGVAAFRADKALEWDPTTLKITNAPDAQQFIDYHYRPGWTL